MVPGGTGVVSSLGRGLLMGTFCFHILPFFKIYYLYDTQVHLHALDCFFWRLTQAKSQPRYFFKHLFFSQTEDIM
jgi:hypothetical protein